MPEGGDAGRREGPEHALSDVDREVHVQGTVRIDHAGGLFGKWVQRGDRPGLGEPQFSRGVDRPLGVLRRAEVLLGPVASVAEYQRIVAAARPGDILVFYNYDPALTQRSLVTVTVE